jgi:hypothetical protein
MSKLNKEIHYDEALEMFNDTQVATQVAKDICEKYGIDYNETEGRKVRSWLNPTIHLPLRKGDKDYTAKVLIYDIETSLVEFNGWWTGKQYVGHDQLMSEPRIITISYKWLNSDKVHVLTWDKKQCDKKLMKEFLEIYNSADMVIGQNNDRFDNRFINARAMKYNLDVNTYIKSFDIMKQTKNLFRLPSYSMAYITKFLGIAGKLQHTGISMWRTIQYGTHEESAKALQLMSDYNAQDVLATEEMYLKLRKYMGNITHLGVLSGESKISCPNCGGDDISLYKTNVTSSGAIQRIMICNTDKVKFKISNRDFLKLSISK